jgi:hypothetical protein
MAWYNFCENIHKFHNSLKTKIRLVHSLYRIRTRTTFSQCDKKNKMKHIKSPEKKISTNVLFMTLYHTLLTIHNQISINFQKYVKFNPKQTCIKFTSNNVTVTWRCYHHQWNVTVLCQRSNQAPQMSTYV